MAATNSSDGSRVDRPCLESGRTTFISRLSFRGLKPVSRLRGTAPNFAPCGGAVGRMAQAEYVVINIRNTSARATRYLCVPLPDPASPRFTLVAGIVKAPIGG